MNFIGKTSVFKFFQKPGLSKTRLFEKNPAFSLHFLKIPCFSNFPYFPKIPRAKKVDF